MLDSLPKREAEIIRYRFGLDGYDPTSLQKLGDIFQLTKERIRQIERSAINRLKKQKRSRLLKPYMT